MAFFNSYSPTDAKKGEIKCPVLDFKKLAEAHAKDFLLQTCLCMEEDLELN